VQQVRTGGVGGVDVAVDGVDGGLTCALPDVTQVVLGVPVLQGPGSAAAAISAATIAVSAAPAASSGAM
jgi:hypothetical protein